MSKTISLKNVLRLIGIAIVLIALKSNAFSQTVALPDTNFRNVLLSKYPSVMTGNNLNITAAHNFIFDLLIPNANISDLTGVEHFTSVYKIDASYNKITKIPDLSANTHLEYLYLNFNQLTNVNFMVGNTNLLQLQLFNNRLTSFPELPGFTKLQQLLIPGNQISWITGLSHLINLTNLQIGANKFDSLPDISQNIKLTELHCDRNNIKELKGIENLSALKILYCWGNQISDLSLLNTHVALEELYAKHNLLKTLPVLSNKPALKNLVVSNNYLTFEDLLPVTNLPNVTNFVYAPQDSIGEKESQTIRISEPLTLTFQDDAGLTSNTYSWYKNNVPLANNASRTYSIAATGTLDAGDYRVEITNTALPLLTLYRRTWTISINNSCMEVLSYGYRILRKDCRDGTEIHVDLSTAGSQLPLRYILGSKDRHDSIHAPSEILSNIPAGKYTLSIKDGRGCQVVVDSNLIIHRTSDCDPVISPLSNGAQSTYFIDKPGLARILDMNGIVLRELNAPATWDGTKADGSFLETGYYVITIDNRKHTNISILR